MIKTLKDAGYHWLLVQEHSVEQAPAGGSVRYPHLPHRLIARNSRGQTLSIIAIIKTQGSDTKLVGQMQPYYEAKNLSRTQLANQSIPPMVTQIADGENGGVMMNEFPPKYLEVMSIASGSDTAPVNVTEYLEYLQSLGLGENDFPPIQPILQHRIWSRLPDAAGPEALTQLIQQLQKEDNRFHMEGGSWTNNISWVRGYDSLLCSMESTSALFAQKVLAANLSPSDPRYRNALFHLLTAQTSCYRYWGQGLWTDYGREICSRATRILQQEL
jgi:hypothetical protein